MFQSWQDLKRYESLKAKESMAKLCTVNEPPLLELSPLQEKIANLLNLSISVSSSRTHNELELNKIKQKQATLH